jgi:SH3 domain protein
MFLLVAMAAVALAQPFYVNDVIKVTLRAGPGYDHKILAVLNSGDQVQLIERGKDWSRVRIPEGPEGWMATRLLTEEEPNILKIRRLEAQLADRSTGDPGPDTTALEAEIQRLKNALAEARAEMEAVRQANGAVENPRPPRVNESQAEARTRIQELENRLSECQARLEDQTLTAGIRWFLAGAGVLLFGLLIGMKFRRRQRSGLL